MDINLLAAIVTAAVTLIVALTGYLITYVNNIRLSQRTEQLNRVNRQLGELYGPLYSLSRTGDQVYKAFRTKYRPGVPYFGNNPPPTEEDLKAWRLWVSTVFMPRNTQIQHLIINKADLLIETDIPECLNALCAHVAAYQAELKKWENGDFSEWYSEIIKYPGKVLLEYSEQSFKSLKEKQKKLIGEITKERQ